MPNSQADTADADVSRLGITYPDAGVYVLSLRQHSRERIRWLEIALAAARRLKDRENEGCALGNLGVAYNKLGETRRAIQFYEQALLIDREISDRRGEGIALWNMSWRWTNSVSVLKPSNTPNSHSPFTSRSKIPGPRTCASNLLPGASR